MSMTADELDKRQAIIDACRRTNALGVNQGTSGNISVPPLLSGAEIERVLRRMAGYGLAEG